MPWARILLLAIVLSMACEETRPPEPPLPIASTTRATPVLSSVPAPVGSSLIELRLDGFGPSVLAVPSPAPEPRPLVVALHAHAIRPEHACTRWFRAAREEAFVLCPLGLPADAKPEQAVTLGSPEYTAREVAAGVSALRARFGERVSPDPPILAAWSHGSKIGARMVSRDPSAFGSIALGEGAYELLDDPTLARWAKKADRRLLLLCSTKHCETTFNATAKRCERHGLACRVIGSGGHSHPFDGEVVDVVRAAWPWLLRESQGGDPH